MAALSLLQFGNPGMPSFLGDFFGGRHAPAFLFLVIWTQVLRGIQRQDDGKDCVPLTPQEQKNTGEPRNPFTRLGVG